MNTLADNRKAHFNYEILETFQAGLVLTGQEVKSIKSGRVNLAGSYVLFRGEELFLIGATIPPYQPKNAPPGYDPARPRKLLLTKDEIKYLFGRSQQKGLTVVPIRVYNKRGHLKIEIGLVKPRKKWDKREVLKKRAIKRDIERELK